ncbi:hypothetical protein NKH77_28880 [Streptomyces sp. M19]
MNLFVHYNPATGTFSTYEALPARGRRTRHTIWRVTDCRAT